MDEEDKSAAISAGVAAVEGVAMEVDGVSVPSQYRRESHQSALPSSTHVPGSSGVVSWDFRSGVLPHGVEVVGGEPIFMTQTDGSTVLRLAPQSYMKVFK